MSRRPLAADLWEQALLNGRRIHPGDDAAALSWAEQWYAAQGGAFDGPTGAAPAPEPADLSALSDEQFTALAPQGEHATGDFEPAVEAQEPDAQEPAVAPEPARPGKQRRRARQDAGHFRGDDPATPGVNEAWESGGDAA